MRERPGPAGGERGSVSARRAGADERHEHDGRGE